MPQPTEIEYRNANANNWQAHGFLSTHRVSLRFMPKIFAPNSVAVNSATRLTTRSTFGLRHENRTGANVSVTVLGLKLQQAARWTIFSSELRKSASQ